jgi:hypothetical protein
MASPRIRAWLEILEFTCEPGEITSVLGIAPSATWTAGEPHPAGGRPHEESGWRLASPLDDSHDLEVHARWLLDRLPAELDLKQVTPEWWAQLTYVVEVADETPGMSFSAEVTGRLAALGVNLDIDLYVLPLD